jgi:hypothetical protein
MASKQSSNPTHCQENSLNDKAKGIAVRFFVRTSEKDNTHAHMCTYTHTQSLLPCDALCCLKTLPAKRLSPDVPFKTMDR